MRSRLVASFAALASVVSLATSVSVAGETAPAIVHLAFRDHVVTISSSAEGPRYSVRTRSGEILGENLTDEELLAAHPTLHTRIRSGYAGDDAGSFVWAGRDESLIEPPETSISIDEE